MAVVVKGAYTMINLYPNINENLMTENDKTLRIGATPQVVLEKDLPRKEKYSVDSFFVMGRIEEAGHKINYLFHIMAMNPPIPLPGDHKTWQVCYSVLDETDDTYIAGDKIWKNKNVTCSQDNFLLKFDNAEMSGTWDKMKIYLKTDDFEIDTEASAKHYPLYTRGSSVFDMFGMMIHQFSVPYMKTTGTFTLKGHKYKLNGENAVSWFDRQWQIQNFKITTEWTWFACYLDNGDVLSIMSADGDTETPQFMTVLKTDGSLLHSTNFKDAKKYETRRWVSEKTKRSYGTRWDIELADFNAKLHIEPIIENQEIPSAMEKLSKYEGTAKITGIYEGKEVMGRCTIEIIKI